MKSEKAFYQQKIKELDKERRMVIGNPALLEKYARVKIPDEKTQGRDFCHRGRKQSTH
jgi:hypothetical protein